MGRGRFSRGVVHDFSGCVPASFLRLGCLVPINSYGRLGFFIVAPSVCWLVAAVELVKRGFDCCKGCLFLRVRAFVGFICLIALIEVLAWSLLLVVF